MIYILKKTLMEDLTLSKKKLANHKQLRLATLLIALMILCYSCTPKLSSGTFKGNESITIVPGNTYWPGIIKPWWNLRDSYDRQWFHEVIITIKGSQATITKRPFYVKDGIKHFSDSTGGFYFYMGDIHYNKQEKTSTVFCRLSSCTFCPRTGTATPLYIYEYYKIRKTKNRLVVNTEYEEGLIFTRQ